MEANLREEIDCKLDLLDFGAIKKILISLFFLKFLNRSILAFKEDLFVLLTKME